MAKQETKTAADTLAGRDVSTPAAAGTVRVSRTPAIVASGAPITVASDPIGPNPPRSRPVPLGAPKREPAAADRAHRDIAATNTPGRAASSARRAAIAEAKAKAAKDWKDNAPAEGDEVFLRTADGRHMPATVTGARGTGRIDLVCDVDGDEVTITNSPHDPTGEFPDSWHRDGEPEETAAAGEPVTTSAVDRAVEKALERRGMKPKFPGTTGMEAQLPTGRASAGEPIDFGDTGEVSSEPDSDDSETDPARMRFAGHSLNFYRGKSDEQIRNTAGVGEATFEKIKRALVKHPA